jgi:Tol biopolymer transport system component
MWVTETFRPFITDAYGNRVPISPAPAYQYQSLNGALSISGAGKATGVAIGRGSVSVTAMGFTDTMWASVVPKGRIAINESFIVEANLDGSAFDSIPNPRFGVRTLDWSEVNRTFIYDASTSDHLISQDTTGHAHVVITNPLMRSEYYPRYSHEGAYIYFSGVDSVTNCWGIWRVHPDGSALEHVVADTVSCGPYAYTSGPAPYWGSSPSPDGTRVVYVGDRNIPYIGGILRVRTLATGADTSLGVAGAFPRWSPTGEWIAYDSLGILMLIHPDGTGHEVLLDRGDVLTRTTSWSPDGEWLVYSGLVIVQARTGLTLPLPFSAGLTDATWMR